MPEFDDPNLFAIESDEDAEWIRSLVRVGYQIEKARKGKPRARADREARPEAARFMTENQLCALLHVGRDAVRRFRRDRLDPLPAMKVGRRYVYDPDAIRRWAERHAERAARPKRPPIRPAARSWRPPWNQVRAVVGGGPRSGAARRTGRAGRT